MKRNGCRRISPRVPIAATNATPLRTLSRGVGAVVNSSAVSGSSPGDREQLAALRPIRQAPEKVLRRFGWGMAIAATLAIGIIVAPKQRVPVVRTPRYASSSGSGFKCD